jgi:hypothetical protein
LAAANGQDDGQNAKEPGEGDCRRYPGFFMAYFTCGLTQFFSTLPFRASIRLSTAQAAML